MASKNLVIIFGVFILAFVSCKSSHKTTAENEYKGLSEIFDNVTGSYGNWNTFTTSGKLSISFGKSFSSSMQIKMVKGKSISISIRPLLGIEMGRVYITGDSVYVIDKINKQYFAEKITSLTKDFPFDLNVLQNILLNRTFAIGEGYLTPSMKSKVNIDDIGSGIWSISPKRQHNGFTYSFLMNKANLSSLEVLPVNLSKPCSVLYENFQPSDMGTLASTILVEASSGTKNYSLKFNIDISRINWDSPVNESVSIGANYKRIPLKALTGILKSLA